MPSLNVAFYKMCCVTCLSLGFLVERMSCGSLRLCIAFLINLVNGIAFNILYLMMKRFDDSELFDYSLLQMVLNESYTKTGRKCS